MNLNPLQQRIISQLEPIPADLSQLTTASFLERSQVRFGKSVTAILRSLRRGEPMNWDPWILPDGEVYRLFYLRGLAGQNPWWTISKVCGAISTDLQHWQDLGTLLEPNPEHPWESGRILAGCTHKEEGLYYLFYAASGTGLELKNEAIGLATSVDGLHWQRHHHYLVQPDEHDRWYGRCNWTGHFHWRDPYVFKDPQTSRYYLFICASSKTPGDFQGCVGLAVADQITGPYELLPPVLSTPTDTAADWPYYHTERPQVIFKDDQYHLFFSCFRTFLNPRWLQKTDLKRITTSSLYWYVSDTITGPFQPAGHDGAIVAGSDKTGLYGTNLLQVATEPEQFIAYGWYHRLHTLEVSPVFQANWQNPAGLTLSLAPKGQKYFQESG